MLYCIFTYSAIQLYRHTLVELFKLNLASREQWCANPMEFASRTKYGFHIVSTMSCLQNLTFALQPQLCAPVEPSLWLLQDGLGSWWQGSWLIYGCPGWPSHVVYWFPNCFKMHIAAI